MANTIRTMVELMVEVLKACGDELTRELTYRIEEASNAGRSSKAEHGTPAGATKHDRDIAERRVKGIGAHAEHPHLWSLICDECRLARNAYNKDRKDRQERAATTVFERALMLRPQVMEFITQDGAMAELMTIATERNAGEFRIGWCVNGDPVLTKVGTGGSDRILDVACSDDAVRVQALIDFNLIGWNGPQRKQAGPLYPRWLRALAGNGLPRSLAGRSG